jgi:hypothetical protein
MAKLYSNENFPLQVVEGLRALGHDVLTSYDSGKANQSIFDADVLAFAAKDGRILVTLNRRHFIGLHRSDSNHAGIVVCSYYPDFAALAKRIHEALIAQPDMRSQLVRINLPG